VKLLLDTHALIWYRRGDTREPWPSPPVAPIGARNTKGQCSLGASWGLRTQAANCCHYAAVETPSSETCVKAKCCRSGIPSLRLDLSGWKSLTNIKAPQF